MKTFTPVLVLAAALFCHPAAAQQPVMPRGPMIDPTTGLPVPVNQIGSQPVLHQPLLDQRIQHVTLPPMTGPTQIDPATGLPVEHKWIPDDWSDPGIILTNVDFNGLPLFEVARDLREDFKEQFDILPMPQAYGQDWGQTMINLQLKNVRASDIFNAMNLVFENDKTPLRWELRADRHPLAMLRVLPEANQLLLGKSGAVEAEKICQVIFIGDLLSDANSGGLTLDAILKTIQQVWKDTYNEPLDNTILFHPEAEILVLNGTPEQNVTLQQTLAALRQKAVYDRLRKNSSGTNPKSTETKTELKSSGAGGK